MVITNWQASARNSVIHDGQFTAGKHDEDGRRMSPQRGQLNEGGVASGQHHCFSTTQMTNEEGIQEKQSNIMTNGTQTTSPHSYTQLHTAKHSYTLQHTAKQS